MSIFYPHENVKSQLSIGSVHDPSEAEADAMAASVLEGTGPSPFSRGPAALRRQAAGTVPQVEAPAIVHETLASQGKPLDAVTRSLLEPRFGKDLGDVRIHTGSHADASARAVGAHAYTVGQDLVFAEGRYDPHSSAGKRLLAHELSHTLQQSEHSTPRLQREPTGPQQTPKEKPKAEEFKFTVTWEELTQRKLLPPSLLALKDPPSLLTPPSSYTLGGSGAGAAGGGSGYQFGSTLPASSPALPSLAPTFPTTTPLAPYNPASPSLFPTTPGKGSGSSAAPQAPSRLSLKDFGNLSLGLRIGFPAMPTDDKSGLPPPAVVEALQRAEIFGYVTTGKIPSAYQLDVGKLVGAAWGIFSEKIAPDVARKVAASMSSKIGGTGMSYEFDGVLFADFHGGGLSFTLKR